MEFEFKFEGSLTPDEQANYMLAMTVVAEMINKDVQVGGSMNDGVIVTFGYDFLSATKQANALQDILWGLNPGVKVKVEQLP